MIFRRRRRRDPIEQGWQEVAASLALVPTPEKKPLLAELLDLADESELGPVHRVAQTGEVDVWVFSHKGARDPRTRAQLWVTACLLTSQRPFCSAGWRASRKVHQVIASLQASAAGGKLVEIPEDPGFAEALTVVARDVEVTRGQLSAPVRGVLARAVSRHGEPVVITVGEKRILMSSTGPEVRFAAVEPMLTDTMSLYAALAG